jgi:hypothetical protein
VTAGEISRNIYTRALVSDRALVHALHDIEQERTMKRLAAALAILVLAGAGTASASHIHVGASPSVVSPGAYLRVTAAASPCPAHDQVTLISAAYPGHAFGIGAVYGRTGRHGAFSVRARIRSALAAGRYHVSVRCGGGNLPVLAYFRVR